MLRVGLTGGIGAGKSTVSGRLAEHGAIVIDADQIAREVVAPGTEGLADVVKAFGRGMLANDGSLDRSKLAKLVFYDAAARSVLNGIVHPRVAARSAELVGEAPAEAVLVHDIPLLVENGLSAGFHLVVAVHAPAELRVQRLVARGVPEDDARARIKAQASDEQRRAAADVWLDNSGWPEEVQAAADALWAERLVPFEANVRLHRPVRARPMLADPDQSWPEQATRLIDRLALAAGNKAVRIDHIGSTAVPGLPAKDVIDLQLSVRSLADADAIRDALAAAGFPNLPHITADNPKPSDPDPKRWRKRFHGSADPARPVNVHLREAGSPGWRYALLFRDWLRNDDQSRDEYLELKRQAVAAHAGEDGLAGYVTAKEPWFDQALPRAEAWAARAGWIPPTAS